MIGDGFQYYVWHFWNFPNFNKIWDFGPLIYCRNTLINTRKYQRMFETYYFRISQNLGTQTNDFVGKGGVEKNCRSTFGNLGRDEGITIKHIVGWFKTIGVNDRFETKAGHRMAESK